MIPDDVWSLSVGKDASKFISNDEAVWLLHGIVINKSNAIGDTAGDIYAVCEIHLLAVDNNTQPSFWTGNPDTTHVECCICNVAFACDEPWRLKNVKERLADGIFDEEPAAITVVGIYIQVDNEKSEPKKGGCDESPKIVFIVDSC